MKYTEEQIAFVRKIASGKYNDEITDLFNENFESDITISAMKSLKGNHKISSGLTGHFEKGSKSFNKGKKQVEYMSEDAIERTKSTRFKKGQPPVNYRLIGSERINKDGYVVIKVSDDEKYQDRWVLKHRYIWEKEHGLVPEGDVLIFLNGNKENITLDNLELIRRADLVRINQNNLFTGYSDLNKVAINVARLMTDISKRGSERH